MRFQLGLVLGLAVAAQLHVDGQSSAGYPPPGRLIDIGGRKLHLHCSGTGNPTVILMAGGEAFSIDWALVQPRVAERTRVCSYDRAGLAWSDSGPADETVEQTIADLHTLLRAAGEKGPYRSTKKQRSDFRTTSSFEWRQSRSTHAVSSSRTATRPRLSLSSPAGRFFSTKRESTLQRSGIQANSTSAGSSAHALRPLSSG